MATIYTTQTEFTHNTSPATVEHVWNDVNLTNEEVATNLNTTWRVLKEVKRKNKKFSKVMTSERSKGLTGRIVDEELTESEYEQDYDVDETCCGDCSCEEQSTTYSFRQITRDGENVVKVDVIVGQTTISDITQQLAEQGMSLSKNIEFLVTGYQIPLTPAEVLSGQETDFTVRQQVKGG